MLWHHLNISVIILTVLCTGEQRESCRWWSTLLNI